MSANEEEQRYAEGANSAPSCGDELDETNIEISEAPTVKGSNEDAAESSTTNASVTSEAPQHEEDSTSSSTLLHTKAKLFTVASEDGSWTEIGVGTVAIRVVIDDEDDDEVDDDGNDEEADNTPSARMDVISIEEDQEVLMSTPLVEDDIYVVQHGTILVWSDPEIGRDMALSFNTPDGCKLTTDAIVKYQAQCKELKRKAAAELRDADQTSTDGAHATGGSGASDVGRQDTTPNAMRQVSGVSSEGADDHASPWSVCRGNLPTIALALQNNVRRFALHLRETDKFAATIAAVFRACAQDGDVSSMNVIGRIVVALLGPPFNTDGRILSQFIDNDVIDHTLDIVQHALGRRTPDTGFVDAATRKAKFRNPCNLPPAVVTKIHVLYAAQSLKDLVPLLLDEGDAAGNSLLAVFLLRFKFGLVNDILRHDTCLPNAFVCPETHADLSTMRTFVAFLHDVSKTIKNAMVPFDAKENLYEELFSCGALEYIKRALSVLIKLPITPHNNNAAAVDVTTESPDSPLLLPHTMVSMLCDVVAHMIMFYTKARDAMLLDAASTPVPPLVGGTPLTAEVKGADTAPSSSSTVAVRKCLWQRSNFSINTSTGHQQHSDIFAALMSHDRHTKCFLDVMIDTAVWASSSGVSMVAQSAYDLVYSCCVGLLQGNVYAAVGHNIQPHRRQIVKYLVEGNDHKAPTSPTTITTGTAAADRLAGAIKSHDDKNTVEEEGDAAAVQSTSSTTLEILDEQQHQQQQQDDSLRTMMESVDTMPPSVHDDWPPLYRALYAVGHLSSIATTNDEPPTPQPSWTSSPTHRLSLHYLVRLLLSLTKDPIVGQSLGFPVMIETSRALRTVRIMLEAVVTNSSTTASGSVATVQATCIAWIAELVAAGDSTINQALVTSGVMLPVVDLFIALHGRRRGGGSILGSSAAHALDNVHQSIHRKKGTLKTTSSNGGHNSSSPLLHNSFSSNPLQGGGSGITSNPFLRSIGKDGLDSSRTKSLVGDSSTMQAYSVVDVALVQQILQLRGDALRQSIYPSHRSLATSLEHVVEETPEEASEELSSREASSVAVSAAVMSDLDFNALLAEYGPDAPVSDSMLREVVGDDVAHCHSHHATSSDDDDEAQADVHVGEGAEDESNDAERGEEKVGFLLRRESTIRGKRSRTPPPTSPTDSAPPLSDDDENDDDEAATDTTEPPAAKQARGE